MRRCTPLASDHTHPQLYRFLPLRQLLSMSQSTTTGEASSRFQAIFQAALKSYQKQTKADLLAHPLVSQLQSCDSTAAIVAILQDQLQDLDKSRSGDERLTKWLNPTVNVLSAFSATISGGVSLVSLHVILVAFLCIFFFRYFRLRV
jgi:hypothetical protein